MSDGERGFTLIEVLIAVVLLAVGVLAVVGSSSMVTRMVGRGKNTTFAAQIAEQRLELLRAIAASTNPPCTSADFTSSGAIAAQGLTESWTISTTPPLWTRTATVTVTYRVPGGVKSASVSTLISCF